jgi:hypothetical protein
MKLFKGTIVVAGIILASHVANAQSIGIGIKGGLNFAKLNGNQSLSQNYDNRTGYHVGGYALFKLGKIGIQPELLYSQQGTKYSVNINKFDANFSYINIPVLIKLYTVAGINLQVGPQIGFATNSTATVTNDAGTQTFSQFIKGKDISVAMGLGWDLPFGLSIDARYNLGVSDNNNSPYTGQVKNQVIMISAGYRLFKLGK